MVMAVLGGMGTVFGPVIGAVAFLLLEEVLSRLPEFYGIHLGEFPGLILGPMLLAVALYASGGIDGILMGLRRG
jgi:branched-chain amino acid transport system permease protein